MEPIVCDLSDLDAVDDACPLPPVDVLVNNAGLQHVAPVPEFDPDALLADPAGDAGGAVPARAPRPAPHVRPRLGRLVHVSSAHGHRASPFKAAYVSAKHGLEGLSKVIALEAAEHGVTSNCVSPGYVRTPLVERQIADQARAHGIAEDEVRDRVLLAPEAVKRLIDPHEVAEVAAVLWGPASASITGSSLSVDGGWTAR